MLARWFAESYQSIDRPDHFNVYHLENNQGRSFVIKGKHIATFVSSKVINLKWLSRGSSRDINAFKFQTIIFYGLFVSQLRKK